MNSLTIYKDKYESVNSQILILIEIANMREGELFERIKRERILKELRRRGF